MLSIRLRLLSAKSAFVTNYLAFAQCKLNIFLMTANAAVSIRLSLQYYAYTKHTLKNVVAPGQHNSSAHAAMLNLRQKDQGRRQPVIFRLYKQYSLFT